MLGYEVNHNVINQKSAEAVIDLRKAFGKIEVLAKWLANNPGAGANDPLVVAHGFNEDEAYILRVFFETFDTVRINNEATFDLGRKVTGLE